MWNRFFEVILVIVHKLEVIGRTYGKHVIICFGSIIWLCEDLSRLEATHFIFSYFEKPTTWRFILVVRIYKMVLGDLFVCIYVCKIVFGAIEHSFTCASSEFNDLVISSRAEHNSLSEQ